MNIRKEEEKDYTAIYHVVKKAFENAEHTDGNEHHLVDALRNGDAYIPALALVAEIDHHIVGHIMFTKATINDTTVLALAPLSVLPEYQRMGIGTALILTAHCIAKKLGYGYSVVLGIDTYYPRLGYIPADTLGIHPPFDVPRENFMACKLDDTALPINGVITYAKEFGIE